MGGRARLGERFMPLGWGKMGRLRENEWDSRRCWGKGGMRGVIGGEGGMTMSPSRQLRRYDLLFGTGRYRGRISEETAVSSSVERSLSFSLEMAATNIIRRSPEGLLLCRKNPMVLTPLRCRPCRLLWGGLAYTCRGRGNLSLSISLSTKA